MASKRLNGQLEKQIEEAKAFWKDKPRMTDEQLDAVDQFANKKSELFDKALNSSEKVEKVDAMYQKALKKK